MNRLAGILLVVAIAATLISVNVSALESDQHRRFSIAISGGASKGAYEAGLNWAMLKLARESENLKTLGGGRIRPLEMVSIAGASAGGINSILSGLTWCSLPESAGGIASRIEDNVFRDTWLGVDINSLLPPLPDSDIYVEGDALLSRRDYLVSANELLQSWRKSAYRRGCRVPLGVTVTRVEPLELKVGDIEVQNQRFYIPFELRVQEDAAVGFFFNPADYPTLSDPDMILMPRPRDAPEFSIPDESIIEAAVTTSAFPAAFGRRRLQYCGLLADPGVTPPQSDSDMVCPDGYQLEEAIFADGGLFDNLPVGMARKLAELNSKASSNPFPVTYFYLDPNHVRYQTPDPAQNTACASDDPPDACRVMDFSLFSESSLLVGALGTARRYELYRETTSAHWRHNLSQLAYDLAQILDREHADFDCGTELPYFEKPITCAEAVRAAGRLLEIGYDRIKPEIIPPYSAERLVQAGVADNCERSSEDSDSESHLECLLDVIRYRDQIAEAFLSIIKGANMDDIKLSARIGRARQSAHDDRILRVSSRGAPITGTLLGDFGSFLDYKFREYDYYVGVYDAIFMATKSLCGLQYPPKQQGVEFRGCVGQMGKQLYGALDVGGDPRGRYVFARIAEQEFARSGLFESFYSPLPPVDLDMQIIHDGLAAALEAGEVTKHADKGFFAAEDSFFEYLRANNFTPTETEDGAEPLLAEIIADPETWGTEMTRRISARLVYLERQAADIFAEREPDPDLRKQSYTPLMGATAHLLQSATYKYPGFTFFSIHRTRSQDRKE